MDPPILISGGYDPKIIFWNAHKGSKYKSLVLTDHHINCIDVKYNSKTMAVGGNPCIRFYDLNRINDRNKCLTTSFSGHTANVTSLGFDENGRWLFSASEDATVKIWDLRTIGQQFCRSNLHSAIHSAVLHPNHMILIFGDQDGKVSFWDLRSNKILNEIILEHGVAVKSVAVSPDSCNLAVATNSGFVYNISLTLYCEIMEQQKFLAHDGQYVLKCKYSPNSKFLATTSSDSTCILWNKHPDSIEKYRKFYGHSKWVWDCAFSNDSLYIITASSDSTCKLWDIESERKILDYVGHSKAITTIALLDNFDGNKIPHKNNEPHNLPS